LSSCLPRASGLRLGYVEVGVAQLEGPIRPVLGARLDERAPS
jgi:hypothetical protein